METIANSVKNDILPAAVLYTTYLAARKVVALYRNKRSVA